MLMKPHWPTDAFEQWWSIYPRRVAKKFALKCFERLRSSGEVPFEVLMSATHNYACSVAGKDMQYVCHPATWLNQGRWDDDPQALITGQGNVITACDNLIDRLRRLDTPVRGGAGEAAPRLLPPQRRN